MHSLTCFTHSIALCLPQGTADGVSFSATDICSLCCRHRATRLCIEAAQNLMKACGGDLQFEGPGWNSCTVDMIRVAKAHSMLVLHQTFVDAVDKLQRAVSPAFDSCPADKMLPCCIWPCYKAG